MRRARDRCARTLNQTGPDRNGHEKVAKKRENTCPTHLIEHNACSNTGKILNSYIVRG